MVPGYIIFIFLQPGVHSRGMEGAPRASVPLIVNLSQGFYATENATMNYSMLPPKQGLYDPRNERDACGVGMLADLRGNRSHDIIVK